MNNNIFLIIMTGFLVTSCGSDSKKESDAQIALPVDPKYSLAKDRAEFDKLRESIPADVKKQNDEKALLAEWMGELKNSPEVVFDKFNNLVRKKRELFNKDIAKSREEFSKNEKKSRAEFLKNLADDREDFLKRKVEREKRADFFTQQDEARRTFFAEQREKRDEYESDIREKRKNFDDYIKEKTDDFHEELRNYNIKWKVKQEKQKLEKESK